MRYIAVNRAVLSLESGTVVPKTVATLPSDAEAIALATLIDAHTEEWEKHRSTQIHISNSRHEDVF